MLEKPDLPDDLVVACLGAEYGLPVAQIVFLPLGADRNTAVYRVVTDDNRLFFLKLRRGLFDEISVGLAKFLGEQGVRHIIAPLGTKTEQLWASLGAYQAILYPFIEGRDGYEVSLSDRHWVELGETLKRIHSLELPPGLSSRIQQESYSPRWREIVQSFLERVEGEAFNDPVAAKLAAFLKAKRAEILDLVGHADQLAQALQSRSPEFVLCHSDIHAGNILIEADDRFYIVDWDDPILAAKERDLMFIGGSLMGNRRAPQEEESLFYRGYGQTQIDPIALAYYRYERIIQDIAAFCEQIFLTSEGGPDREQSLHYLMSNFLPDSTIEIAYRSDQSASEGFATD